MKTTEAIREVLEGEIADMTPDDPSWAGQLEEFCKRASIHVDDPTPGNTTGAAFVFTYSDGGVDDDFIAHGDRAPLIAALRAMLASLESSDV